MMQTVAIPFVGPSYEARSKNANNQRCVNLYLEGDPGNKRAPNVLYGTPGLRLLATLIAGPARGLLQINSLLYVVSGNTVYSLDTSFTATVVGMLSTASGKVSMATNGTQIIIVDGLHGYIVDYGVNAVNQILDAGFPNGVTIVDYIDTYFVVSGDGSQRFYISANLDGTSWNALDYASAESHPRKLLGHVSYHGEIWLFTEDCVEVWNNTGDIAFPFQSSGTTVIEHGCAAGQSIALGASRLFWLGLDGQGVGPVWMTSGYVPQRISNPNIEREIQSYDADVGVSDALAFCYQQDGHLFYVLTFPAADRTWVYDIFSNQWHERAWRNPLTDSQHRWRPSAVAFFNGLNVACDYADGRIYAIDLDYFKDDTDPIQRVRVTETIAKEQTRLFYNNVLIDMETGVGIEDGSDPKVMLRWSNDGGHTWSNQRFTSMGAIGQTKSRVQFHRCGSGCNRVWELTITDPVKVAIMGAKATVDEGVW